MKRLTLFVIFGTLVSGCTVGHRITRFDPPNPHVNSGDQAAYYALPRTVITVTVPVEKTDFEKGPCHTRLSEPAIPWLKATPTPTLREVIGLQDPKSFDPSYKVKDDMALGRRAEPDPDEIFRVDLGSSAFTKRNLDLQFGPLGVLKSGTSAVQDRRVDIAVSAFKSALDIVSGLRAFVAPTVVESSIPKDRCHRAAYDIRQARQDLEKLRVAIANGNAVPGESAQWLEARIEKDIARSLRVFITKEVKTGSVVCEIRPHKNDHPGKTYDVFRFGEKHGIEAAPGARCSIPEAFRNTSGSGCDTYSLTVMVTDGQFGEQLRKAGVQNAHDDSQNQGFYYRVPAVAQAVLAKGSTAIKEEEMVVAQLGIVAALPRQRTYQSKYTVTLDPETGALKQLVSDSEAIDKSLVADAGSGISSFLEAERERDKARAQATDELTLLERERKILEERKKIRDFKEELGESDNDD